VLLAGFLLVALACGGGGGEGSSDTSAATTPDGSAGTGATEPEEQGDDERVVALGEEFLLADLLALGIEPVASTATTADAGFQGLDDHDTTGIQPLPSTEPNFERLASLRPDTIVAAQFVIDALGREQFDALADLVVVPTAGGAEQLEILGEEFDREEQAATLRERLEEAEAGAAGTAPPGCEVSLATVYPGPAPAAWVAQPNAAAVALEDMGCTLSPSTDDAEPDGAGRVRLSLEQLGLLDAPELILLQSDTVEGERDSVDALTDDPLWKQLPAVQAGRVTELDRLGYPGVEGKIRLYEDLADALEER
jgi:iron complex transport system substrate-binding protein